MTRLERVMAEPRAIRKSYQQLDPVGGYSARPITIILCFAIVAYAGWEAYVGWWAVIDPALEIAALVSIAVAMVGVFHWSSALRAPFPRHGFIIVVALAIAAMFLDAFATWHGADLPPGFWGPPMVGLTILQCATYRPASEVWIATTVGAVGAAAIALLHPATAASGTPGLVTFVTLTVPLMAFGFGGAANASSLGRALARTQSSEALNSRMAASAVQERIRQSVQHDRVSILNRTVVPFYTEVLVRGSITQEDREHAARVATSIRSVMVAEAERTWLDTVVDELAGAGQDDALPGSEVVQDDDLLAGQMDTEQRIVLRALLVSLFEEHGFDPDGFGIVITRAGDRCETILTAKLDGADSIPRSNFAAYLAVVRIVFGDLQLTFQAPTLTLRFSYGHK